MKIKIEELKKICIKVLVKKGLSKENALIFFNEYLDGELRGRECHGFSAFKKFGAKLIDFEGEPEIVKEADSYLYIDGKKNLGQIVCNKFVPKLIEKAKKSGIAMMGIKNMHSYLMPGTYARMMARDNMVGFVLNYGGAPRIAPAGSIDPIFGTNPIAVGIPNKDFPIVIDMATSKIAMGKVRLAEKLGKQLPGDVAIDKDGNPTTDPTEAMNGALFPFDGKDGYKGSALALMVEILSKTMFKAEPKKTRGFLFICFDPTVFQPIEEFKKDTAELVKKIKNSRKREGVEEIFVPDERSQRLKQKNNKKDYLEIDERIINDIKKLL